MTGQAIAPRSVQEVGGLSGAGAGAPSRAHALVVRWWPPVVFLVAFLALWELVSPTGWVLSPVLLPPPTRIASATVEVLASSYFPRNFARTAYETVVGFGLAVSGGLVLGTLVAVVPWLRLILYPYIITFQAMPKIVFIPIFLVLFGFGAESKIVTAVAIAFFPIFMNTVVGLNFVEEDSLRLMQSLQASRWQVFAKLRVPSSLPLVFAGVKTSVTLAMTGAIAAEFLAGTDLGLGRLVSVFSFQLQMDAVFVLVLLVALIAYLLFTAIEKIGQRVVFWGEEEGRTL